MRTLHLGRHADITEHRAPTTSTTRTRGGRARTSMGVDAVLAATGLAGGAWMATHPRTTLSLELLEGTPFDSWLLPGVALMVVNGIWPLVALVLTRRGHRLAPVVQCAVGVSLLGWLLVQIPLVGYATMFQIPYSALAIGLLVLNIRQPVRS